MNYKLARSFIDKITINDTEELFFTVSIEKHTSWTSNYGRGKTLQKGELLLKVIDGTLYLKYFGKSEERSGVDYKTGSFSESNVFLEIEIENSSIQFGYPEEGSKQKYKLVENKLIFQAE